MKVILYLAQTANGYIAKENDSTPWSKEEFTAFYSFVKKARNLVIGKKTFLLMKNGELGNCGYPLTVVVTRSLKKVSYKNSMAAKSPKEALKILRKRGFRQAVIGGGSRLATSFLKQGLIDEIYLDIEPLILGKGIQIFQKGDIMSKLKLIKTTRLSKDTIRLHYRIL